MLDPTKILYDDSFKVKCRQVLPNGTTLVSERTYTNTAKAIANRERLKPNPLTATSMQISESRVNTSEYTRVRGSIYGTFIGPPDYVFSQSPSGSVRTETIDFSTDGEAAMNRALAKASEFSFGVSIAESSQTINLLTKRIKDLGRFAMALKRGDISKAGQVLNFDLSLQGAARLKGQSVKERLSSGYLEFQFGWMPLLEDASNISKAYAKGLSTEGLKVTSRTGRKASLRGRSNAELLSYVPQASAVFTGRVKNTKARDLQDLGLLNVPLIAWNLVPLSFVFDWFIPVGTFLGGITAQAGLEDCQSTYTDGKMSKVIISFQGQDYLLRSSLAVNRHVSTGLPSLLGLAPQAIHSFGQVVSIAALFQQKVSTGSSAVNRPFRSSIK